MSALALLLLLAAPAPARLAEAEPPARLAEAQPPARPAAPELAVRPLEPGAWVFTQSRPFSANALLVEAGPGDLVLVDALYTPAAMRELLAWVDKKLPKRRLLALNTHFHSDRAGGNAALKERQALLYSSDMTVRLMKTRGRPVMEGIAGSIADEEAKAAFLSAPIVTAESVFSLEKGLKLTVGDEPVEVSFPGPGHSPDNVVVWFPKRRLLFGGCLVLSSERVGNTSDADLARWADSVSALSRYGARTVVTGHGSGTSPDLIERTVETLRAASKAR